MVVELAVLPSHSKEDSHTRESSPFLSHPTAITLPLGFILSPLARSAGRTLLVKDDEERRGRGKKSSAWARGEKIKK